MEGGGAAKVSRTLPVPVSGEPAAFGVESYELAPFNEDGTPATQAGAHPFQLTTTLALNQSGLQEAAHPVELPKDLSFHLPPGLVGNPNAAAQCTMANFFALVLETNLCSPSSVVGVATVTAHEPQVAKVFTKTVPVFNLVPAQGEPARFGFEVIGKVPIVIDTSVRSGQDYGVDVERQGRDRRPPGCCRSQVTLLGRPGRSAPQQRPRLGMRGRRARSPARSASPAPPRPTLPEEPFLTLPTSCASNPAAEPVRFPMEADSWANPGTFLGAEYAWMNQRRPAAGLRRLLGAPLQPLDLGDPRTAHSRHPDGPRGRRQGPAAVNARSRSTGRGRRQGHDRDPAPGSRALALGRQRPRRLLRGRDRLRGLQRPALRSTNSQPPRPPARTPPRSARSRSRRRC